MHRLELEKLLDNPPDILSKNVYIWGTGNTALLYQEGLKRLEIENFTIKAYVDNDFNKWGEYFCRKKIISPLELKDIEDTCVLICSPQPNVIKTLSKQLAELGIEFYHIDEVIFKLHSQELLKVYDDLLDERSKEVYYKLIRARITGNYIEESLLCENQYFALPQFRMRKPNEVFVDCGAFVGDTIEAYIWKMDGVFEKIIAFEPDKNSFFAMQKRISRLQSEWGMREEAIEIYPFALSNEKSFKTIESYGENNGLGSKIVEDVCTDSSCQTVTIDEMVSESISFLKADIEGYEYRMLLGASESIKKWKPRLAICIYHNAVDFYAIPLFVKSLVPEYQIAIRHHSYLLDETVLYAWID